jgi:hypothetical protein
VGLVEAPALWRAGESRRGDKLVGRVTGSPTPTSPPPQNAFPPKYPWEWLKPPAWTTACPFVVAFDAVVLLWRPWGVSDGRRALPVKSPEGEEEAAAAVEPATAEPADTLGRGLGAGLGASGGRASHPDLWSFKLDRANRRNCELVTRRAHSSAVTSAAACFAPPPSIASACARKAAAANPIVGAAWRRPPAIALTPFALRRIPPPPPRPLLQAFKLARPCMTAAAATPPPPNDGRPVIRGGGDTAVGRVPPPFPLPLRS